MKKKKYVFDSRKKLDQIISFIHCAQIQEADNYIVIVLMKLVRTFA